MTRVAYVGNFKPAHSTENEVKFALETLGVQVVCYQEDDWLAWNSLAEFEPGWFDFVLWTKTWEGDLDQERRVLVAVRAKGVMVVGYHLDRWWGLDRQEQIFRHPFFTHTDLLCTADGGHDDEWRKAGIRHEWFPPAVSARHVGLAEADPMEYPHEIVFVGSYRTYHSEWPWRRAMIEALRKRYRRDGRFGLYPMTPGSLRGEGLAKLYATAKVVIGDSCLAGSPRRYWSDRVPETVGRGGVLLHPWVEGLEDSYAFGSGYLWGYEADNVSSLFEVLDKALSMPDDERALARSLGVECVGRSETYEHRMERLLALVGVGSGRRRAWAFGKGAVFLVRDGSTDATVIDETWRENVYRLDPEWVRDGCVVDIGANIGAVSLWAAVHGAREVVAVEPDPANLAALRSNLDENPDGQIVEVCPYAVNGDVGPVVHRWALMSGKGGEAKVKEWLRDPAGVEACSFAEVFEGLDVVDLLKIDIEGGEWEILCDSRNVGLIAEKVRRMVVEFHGPGMMGEHEYDLASNPEESAFKIAVGLLAEVGKVEILGRPSVGGLIWWEAYR